MENYVEPYVFYVLCGSKNPSAGENFDNYQKRRYCSVMNRKMIRRGGRNEDAPRLSPGQA